MLHVRDTPPTTSAAEPAVYVHGLGGSSQNFTDVAALLADRFDGQAVDLPGFGYSDPSRALLHPGVRRPADQVPRPRRPRSRASGRQLARRLDLGPRRGAASRPHPYAHPDLPGHAVPGPAPHRAGPDAAAARTAPGRPALRLGDGPADRRGDGRAGAGRVFRRHQPGPCAAPGRGDRGDPAALHGRSLPEGVPGHAARGGVQLPAGVPAGGRTRSGGWPPGSPRRRW